MADRFDEFCLCDRQRVRFLLCVRKKIISSRKNLTDRTHMRRNVLDTVEDHAVFVAEDDVAVLAHQFYDQELLTGIAHLIAVFQLKFYNTFHAGLADTADAGTADMLAEKHTEVRRGERAWFVLPVK